MAKLIAFCFLLALILLAPGVPFVIFFYLKKKALQNGFKTNVKYTNENFHKMHHAWLIANIYVVFMKTDEIKREACCRSKGYN